LENFSFALSAGQFGRLFRAKGLIRVADGGTINFQFAGGAISAIPFNAEVRSRIVLIGYDLDRKRIDEFFANRQDSL
jgi:G3E family GTPase